MSLQNGALIYEGKAKKIFSTVDSEIFILEFKDDLTAFNALKKGQFTGKGEVNCEISTLLFKELHRNQIPTHWILTADNNKMKVHKTKIIPLEVVLRNRIAGSLAKKLKRTEGEYLRRPLIEFYYKNDDLQDPFVNEEQIYLFDWASELEISEIKKMTLKINKVLFQIFEKCGFSLVDFKLEFGKLPSGEIVLADEISPDSMRVWDLKNNERLDKDRFRYDLGDVRWGYVSILNKLKEVFCEVSS